jgi:nitroimidazol reductase NimA-like FMN-containing flavoprotein (pyridoxamine 5'-phosphate oxidase superfamily)
MTLTRRQHLPEEPRVTFEMVLRELRRRDFAVLSTADDQGRPHSVGVEYGVSTRGTALYVMTRRHLRKARDIAANPRVSLVVPLTRRLLWFLPPPCIQFQGRAEILDRDDRGGTETFNTFFMGRRILRMYEELERRGDTRTCFLRITPEPVISTYMVGYSIWEVRSRMEIGVQEVEVPADYRRQAGSS